MFTTKQLYTVSYALKMLNPTWNAGNVCDYMKVSKTEYSQFHPVKLGIWQANKKLGLRGGYARS